MALNILGTAALQEGDSENGLRLSLESASVSGSLGFTWFHGVHAPRRRRAARCCERSRGGDPDLPRRGRRAPLGPGPHQSRDRTRCGRCNRGDPGASPSAPERSGALWRPRQSANRGNRQPRRWPSTSPTSSASRAASSRRVADGAARSRSKGPCARHSRGGDARASDRHRHLPLHRRRGLDAAAARARRGGYARRSPSTAASCARRSPAHGGVEVDTQGDAFFVAFPTAPGALAAAREAQGGAGRSRSGWACTPARPC